MTDAQPAQLPLSEQLPSATIRITTRGLADAHWTSVGTGFVWNEQLANDQSAIFLVTNRHVLAGAAIVGLTVQGQAADGSRLPGPGREVELQLDELRIVVHPDPDVDLALLALNPLIRRLDDQGFHLHFSSVSESIVPTAEQIRDLSAAHPILLVGYPNGVYDEANNLPVVRRGITAVAPWVNYQGKPELLLDIAVFGGSSGSPVFVLDEGILVGRQGVNLGGSRLYFLGVLRAGHFRTEHGAIVQIPAPTAMNQAAAVNQMINLAVCVKAVGVRELVDYAISLFQLQRP